MAKTDSMQIYKWNFKISIYTFLLTFFYSNFNNFLLSFDTVCFILYILPLDSYFLVQLHFSVLLFITNATFPSLNIEEISLVSHVFTKLLVQLISSRTSLPHELFFNLAIFGPTIGVLFAIPFLKKSIRISRLSSHCHMSVMKAKHNRYAIISYFIIIISIFIIQQYMFKKHLTKDKSLVFWLIDYIVYENGSIIRQKMLLWWITCLVISIFFIKTFFYAKESRIFYNNEKILYNKLNIKRKFFHAIIIVMFLPTLYLDPLFSNISFSIALLLFFISEVIRIFVLPPCGLSLHSFLSKFVDERDNKGKIIVSHFYLLIGCASPLWLDFAGVMFDQQKQYKLKLSTISGILCLGFGDSAASLIGKKIGRLYWPNSKKTVEGTIAFILAVFFGGILTKYMSWMNDVIIWTDFFMVTIMTGK
ncbi:hypothetical protein PMAC_000581 [Pneumocystis sp. 'macacae']|nr:hypothetical protein PMAC_000581 [Pneumocystis sp. 'macacae']